MSRRRPALAPISVPQSTRESYDLYVTNAYPPGSQTSLALNIPHVCRGSAVFKHEGATVSNGRGGPGRSSVDEWQCFDR